MKAQAFYRPVPGYRAWTGGGDEPTVMLSLTLSEVEQLADLLELGPIEVNELLKAAFLKMRVEFRDWHAKRSAS